PVRFGVPQMDTAICRSKSPVGNRPLLRAAEYVPGGRRFATVRRRTPESDAGGQSHPGSVTKAGRNLGEFERGGKRGSQLRDFGQTVAPRSILYSGQRSAPGSR